MNLIEKYFSDLTSEQRDRFANLEPLYKEWNAKINVISRKDIAEIYERHVLHSLAIAKFVSFTPGTEILDVGTGGGFPGVPLAIMFPQIKIHCVDSIGKKIRVVQEVANALSLENLTAQQLRVEKVKEKYDFVVSRAVTAFPDFVKLSRHVVKKEQKNAVSNGIIYLKGGDFQQELSAFKKRVSVIELSDYFEEPFFETKKIIHLSI